MFDWFKKKQESKILDTRSAYEKLGWPVINGPATDQPGHDWLWVVGQYKGWCYWHPNRPCLVTVRRKSWPIMYGKKGTIVPAGDGAVTTIQEDFKRYWHLFSPDYCSLKFGPRWFVGWGGCIGADVDEDDWVIVNGKKQYTGGGGWHPEKEDLEALDWERTDEY